MPTSPNGEWKPTFVSRVYGPLSAFVGGGRLWILVSLAGASALALWLALLVNDDYWTLVLLEVFVGSGLFAVLQVFPGVEVSSLERVLLFVSAIALIAVAARASGLWRSILIEVGSGVGLFLAFDLYLAHQLREMEKRERTTANLNLAALELYQQVLDGAGGFEAEEPASFLDGAGAVHGGSDESDHTVQDTPAPSVTSSVYLLSESGGRLGVSAAPGSPESGLTLTLSDAAIYYRYWAARNADPRLESVADRFYADYLAAKRAGTPAAQSGGVSLEVPPVSPRTLEPPPTEKK